VFTKLFSECPLDENRVLRELRWPKGQARPVGNYPFLSISNEKWTASTSRDGASVTFFSLIVERFGLDRFLPRLSDPRTGENPSCHVRVGQQVTVLAAARFSQQKAAV